MRHETRDARRRTEAEMQRSKKLRNLVFLRLFISLLLCFSSLIGIANASEFDNAKQMIMSGQVEAGAQTLARLVQTSPSPEALLLLGKALDRLQDLFSERVEKTCYWGHGSAGTPACAQSETEKLNAIYGAGAFKFVTDIAYVPYTGIHYKELVSKYSGSSEAQEAEFQLLLKDLVGHPSIILSKVKKFLDKHSSGDVGRKALLLWARVNKDVWYIHRSWSWVIYNETISPDELVVRAEPYRQEAMKSYEKIISKYGGTFEAQAAQTELNLLKNNQNDGEVYSILQDTVGGSPDKWGSTIPKPALTATQRGVGEPGWKQTAPTAVPGPQPKAAPSAPAVSQPAEEGKKNTPSRWK